MRFLYLFFLPFLLFFTAADLWAQGGSVKVSKLVGELITQGKYLEAEAAAKADGLTDSAIFAYLAVKQGRSKDVLDSIQKNGMAGVNGEKAQLNVSVIAEGSSTEALELAKQYLKAGVGSDYPPFRHLYLSLLAKAGQFDEAVSLVSELLKTSPPSNPLRDSVFALTIALYDKSRASEAVAILEQLFEKMPEVRLDPAYRLQWCHFAVSGGRSLDALHELDKLQTEHPEFAKKKRAQIGMARGSAFQESGDLNQSRKEFEEVSRIASADAGSAYLLGVSKAKVDELNYEINLQSKIKNPPKATDKDKDTQPVTRNSLRLAWGVVIGFVLLCLFIWRRK